METSLTRIYSDLDLVSAFSRPYLKNLLTIAAFFVTVIFSNFFFFTYFFFIFIYFLFLLIFLKKAILLLYGICCTWTDRIWQPLLPTEFKAHKPLVLIQWAPACLRRKLVLTAVSSYLGTLCPGISEICTKPSPTSSLANFATKCSATKILWVAICGGFIRRPKRVPKMQTSKPSPKLTMTSNRLP